MELDSSGLYHTQTRYYSPTFGRFLSPDAGLQPNAFTYAGNNPIKPIDPTGAFEGPPPVCGGWCAAGLLVGDLAIVSIEHGSLLSGLEALIQDFFDPFNIFGNWFGGGSQPAIPIAFRRRPHYPPMFAISVSAELTPDSSDSAPDEDPLPGGWRVTLVGGGAVAASEAVGEAAIGASAWEAAAGVAAGVGIYELGEYIFARHETSKRYRCELVAEVSGPSGISCAYVCKGYGAIATFPKPAGMASCPKGFDGWFPGP
jgi:hypothetical protein